MKTIKSICLVILAAAGLLVTTGCHHLRHGHGHGGHGGYHGYYGHHAPHGHFVQPGHH